MHGFAFHLFSRGYLGTVGRQRSYTSSLIRSSLAPVVAACLLTTGCGYIAGTLAPLANVPAPPQDLAAMQRGSNIIAHFTQSSLTTEMIPINGAVDSDLRAGPPPAVWSEAAWFAAAQRFSPARQTKIP